MLTENVHKTLPASPDAERAVISCMLQSPTDAISEAIERLTPEHFYVPANGILFGEITALYEAGQPVDLVTLSARLRNCGQMDRIGGPSALADILDDVPTASLLDWYATILDEKYTLRRLIMTAGEIMRRGYDNPEGVAETLDAAEAAILAIRQSSERGTQTVRRLDSVTLEAADWIEAQKARAEAGNPLMGIPTGFSDLDNLTQGMCGGEYWIIAMRPGMGKTALGYSILDRAAQSNGIPGEFLSREMLALHLALRGLAKNSPCDFQKIRSGGLSEYDLGKLFDAAKRTKGVPLYIDDRSDLTPLKIRSRIREAVSKRGVKLVLLDYVQLVGPDTKEQDRDAVRRIDAVSKACMTAAKEHQITVIALAQLNREAEGRTVDELHQGMLKGCGGIEEDAHVVLLGGPWHKSDYGSEADTISIGLKVAKGRNCPPGSKVRLTFLRHQMRIESASYGNQYEADYE